MYERWSQAQSWSENWVELRQISNGGQGVAKEAEHRIGGNTVFVKILSRQSVAERRNRFYREAVAYDTVNHMGVPRLIESNAQHHVDSKFKLYLATEFIPGRMLSEVAPMALSDALTIVSTLLGTLAHCHSLGWIHRDLKPDNVILRRDRVEDPVIVDFGIAFKADAAESFATLTGQEVGNRFLRLPELASGSAQKRDARTDIAFAGALLFFLVTGEEPHTILDGEGRTPSQRPGIAERLHEAAGKHALALLDVFDRTMTTRIDHRYPSAEAMRDALVVVASPRSQTGDAMADDIAAIRAMSEGRAVATAVAQRRLLASAMKQLHNAASGVAAHFPLGTIGLIQSGHSLTAERGQDGFALYWLADDRLKFWSTFTLAVVGDEVVLTGNGTPLHRTSASDPDFGEGFTKAVQGHLTAGFRHVLDNSDVSMRPGT